ncbi:MAG: hypothetical protein KIT84_43550 [Labilithrix sp.]|nr:hypothetical protein [Labilithrix sp.]MCW5817955.1 hypothetical protein [Labilithrix sp.]
MTTRPEPLQFTEAATDPKSVGNALRAVIAGSAATKVIAASVSLFEAGGKLVLDEGSRTALRSAAERGAEKALALAAGPLLGPATMLAKRPATLLAEGAKATKQIAPVAAKAASREILKGAGRAAGIGFVIDGAVAGVEAAAALRTGTMDRKKAATYVAKEATTGAIATGTGMLLGAGLVAVTGGVAAPVVFAVGALGSIGTKRLLRKLTQRPEQVAVREIEAPTPA